MRKIAVLLVSIIFLFNFSFTAAENYDQPKNLKETEALGEGAADAAQKKLPGAMEKIWKEEVLPKWSGMYDWLSDNVLKGIIPRIKEEFERRKEIVKERFQKKKGEIKQEAPAAGKSLWERLKEIIR